MLILEWKHTIRERKTGAVGPTPQILGTARVAVFLQGDAACDFTKGYNTQEKLAL